MFESGFCYIAELPRLHSNLQSSCLSLPTGITVVTVPSSKHNNLKNCISSSVHYFAVKNTISLTVPLYAHTLYCSWFSFYQSLQCITLITEFFLITEVGTLLYPWAPRVLGGRRATCTGFPFVLFFHLGLLEWDSEHQTKLSFYLGCAHFCMVTLHYNKNAWPPSPQTGSHLCDRVQSPSQHFAPSHPRQCAELSMELGCMGARPAL